MSARTKGALPAGQRVWQSLFQSAVALLLLCFVTGCYAINVTKCSVPDTQANRIAASKIVVSVATGHGFEQSSSPLKSVEALACYQYMGDRSQRLISLDAYVFENKITASLLQTKRHKKRTQPFLRVEQDLVDRFKEKFGSDVEVRIYTEEMPL